MRIYVDIDDVLSRTIESLIDLLGETHGRRVEVEEVLHFDLEKSFGLSQVEIASFMDHAHSDEILEALHPVDGGVRALSQWDEAGYAVHLVTGRPPSTNAASRRWLDRHGVPHSGLHHLDKWSRPTWNQSGLPSIGFDDLAKMDLDFAVEDSLDTAVRLVEDFDLPVALMDQPWNRDLSGVATTTREKLVRCSSWDAVEGVRSALR